eukprot:scaffold18928_cov69-Phaeocystis_antarctica.AAC.12
MPRHLVRPLRSSCRRETSRRARATHTRAHVAWRAAAPRRARSATARQVARLAAASARAARSVPSRAPR